MTRAAHSWLNRIGDLPALIVCYYEALLRSLVSSARVTGLCLYPRPTPLGVLHGVLAAHPLAGTGGPIEANPFFDPRVRAIGAVPDALVLSHLAQLDGRAPKGSRARR